MSQTTKPARSKTHVAKRASRPSKAALPFPINIEAMVHWYRQELEQHPDEMHFQAMADFVALLVHAGKNDLAFEFVERFVALQDSNASYLGIELIQVLAEQEGSEDEARKLAPWVETFFDTDATIDGLPCEPYLVIAETTHDPDDIRTARKHVLAMTHDGDIACGRFRLWRLDGNSTDLAKVRAHIRSHGEGAVFIGIGLTKLTQRPDDFQACCNAMAVHLHDIPDEFVQQTLLRELMDVVPIMLSTDITHVISSLRQSGAQAGSQLVITQLEQALAQRPTQRVNSLAETN